MQLQMPHGRLAGERSMQQLFWICWIAYFIAYLGRLNYAACLVEISADQGWSKAQAGLIATAFFAAYGLGQIANGFIGDKLSPKLMVGFGLGVSGLLNLLFPLMPTASAAMVLWCANGLVQSMMWSPLLRLLSEWLPMERSLTACVHLNTTVPIGTLAIYGLSALLITVTGWQSVFYLAGVLLLVMTIIWLLMLHRLEKQVQPGKPRHTGALVAKNQQLDRKGLLWASAIPTCCVAVIMQGMLKDGVTTWIPTFLEEQFQMETAAAILGTALVPVVNLGGVFLASWAIHRWFKNEMLAGAWFFGAGLVTLIVLVLVPGNSALVSLILLALITSFMMSVNTALVSMLPSYYVRFGLCSTISGVLSAAGYLGSAAFSYVNGAVADRYGWDVMMLLWVLCAVIGFAACLVSIRRWRSFRKTVETWN